MGCYDSFVGEIECPRCKNTIAFDEQTKNYECLMRCFKVGDYIDKANESYFYKFEYPCKCCNEIVSVYAAIVKGQLVGYYTNIDNLDIRHMSNIEENYQRNLEYRNMCEAGYGCDKCFYNKDNLFDVGDVIHTLGRDWIVEDIYEERIQNTDDEKLLRFYNFLFCENRVYKVHDDNDNKRLIVSRDTQLTQIVKTIDSYGEGQEYKSQLGTDLIHVE